MRRLVVGVLALLVLGVLALFGLDRLPFGVRDFELDLEEVRALAAAPDSLLPTELRHLVVARAEPPETVVAARGNPFERYRFAFATFQIVTPAGTILVDIPQDSAEHEEMQAGHPFDGAAYARLGEAVEAAWRIVVTHEHLDHMGLDDFASVEGLEGKTLLTRAQLESEVPFGVSWPDELRDRFSPLVYSGMHRLAPGVVLIESAGHTPGSQLVYVRLRHGPEFLVVGDVAWHSDNVLSGRGRPLAVSLFVLREDWGAVIGQLRELRRLRERHPGVRLLAVHDADRLERYVDTGLLREGLRP